MHCSLHSSKSCQLPLIISGSHLQVGETGVMHEVYTHDHDELA